MRGMIGTVSREKGGGRKGGLGLETVRLRSCEVGNFERMVEYLCV